MPPKYQRHTKQNSKSRTPKTTVLSYPNSLSNSRDALILKIARHSPCSLCSHCKALSPSDAANVALDSESASTSKTSAYITTCRCGHTVAEHAAVDLLPSHEFHRRAQLAARIDEYLVAQNKLLDFTYEDDQITYFRNQMQEEPEPELALEEEALSPLPEDILNDDIQVPFPESAPSLFRQHAHSSSSPPPSTKKRRLSDSRRLALTDYSSSPLSEADAMEDRDDDDESHSQSRSLIHTTLSEQDNSQSLVHTIIMDDEESDSDDEEQPLALLNGSKPSNRPVPPRHTGKKAAGHMTLAGATLAAQNKSVVQAPNTNPNEPRRKTQILGEDKIDRLVTGVTVDTEEDSAQGQVKQAGLQLQAGVLSFVSLSPAYPNVPAPREMILLNNLKCLFQKQLPMMPREYITRLIFDKNSHCVAIVKHGLKVVGGICYRVFEHRGFAEIVFLATITVVQGQGYGAMLMNRFKMHIKKKYPGLMHLLTYADNFAVGYFKKQGFTKDVSLNRSIWAGYIKDYEGGTLVQCTLLPKIDYTKSRDILATQRDAILAKIREMSKSDIVYPPLPQFLKAKQGEDVTVDWQSIPGLRDSGWSPLMIEAPRPVSKNPKQTAMTNWLSELQHHNDSWPFREPVNGEEVTDYYDVIKHPMDFSIMEHKLENKLYSDIDAFIADGNLVFDNCLLYNPEDSPYAKCARKLAKFFADLVAEDRERIKFED